MITKVTITSEGRWEREIIAAQDALKIATAETCRFEILDWRENGVTLERQYCDTVMTAEGRGWQRGRRRHGCDRRRGRRATDADLPA